MELLQMFVPLTLVAMVFAQYADPSSNTYDNAENYGDKNNNDYVNYDRKSAGNDNPEYPTGGIYESIKKQTTSPSEYSTDPSGPSTYTSQPPYLPDPSGPSSYTSQPPYSSQSPYYPSPSPKPRPSSYPPYPSYPKPSYSEDPAYTNNGSTYPDNSDYASHSVNRPDEIHVCKGHQDGTKYAVLDVCYAYFECFYGEALYQQCDDYNKFDAKSGSCVPDKNCVSACPDGWKPHPTDNSKFLLGDQEMSCPEGTSFDSKTCSCQSQNNVKSAEYPASY